ncbi:MAG: class I SAM-dependent methyltransferase [Firmicutes bacterium]|nr:class I SAM-dependent methyltransferase [Bacillota bacterium]
MKLPISARLLACCGFVHPNDRVADIGCDHGYLPIYLLRSGIARSVIASDVREKPLLTAVRNAEKYGVRDRMEFYLSDGASQIPRDFDVLVCAGMGADTMISILSAAPWLREPSYRLILQCQSKTPTLRKFLSDTGWQIARESALRDGRFLYTVMEVLWAPDAPRLTVMERYFPLALLAGPSGALPAYYRWVRRGLEISVERRGASADPEQRSALAELTALARAPELTYLMEGSE